MGLRWIHAAVFLAVASTSASADMGVATRWLFSKPMTRLDWLVVNGTRQLQEHFSEANEESEIFRLWLKSNHFKPGFTHLAYDRDKDELTAWYSTQMTIGVSSDADCVNLLMHLRDQMMILSENRNVLSYLGTPEGHTLLAADLMRVWARSPSRSEQVDAPGDLGAKLAAITKVKVMLFGAGLALPMAACSGSLSGTDFKQGTE